MAAIDEALVAARDDPRGGQVLRNGSGSWCHRRAGRHRIIYRYDDDEVFVIRILHISMDERRHLP